MAARRLPVRSLSILIGALASSLAVACADQPAVTGQGPGSTDFRTTVRVLEVVDGDTIRVEFDGASTPVRLIGIDTPETDGPYTDEECFGVEASRYTERALDGRSVDLEFDVERTDRFDRTLAYVWLDGELFNEGILLDGFAQQATFPPNVRYVERFTEAQRSARATGAGLWGSCPAG
jgi:micrococcal nuclease